MVRRTPSTWNAACTISEDARVDLIVEHNLLNIRKIDEGFGCGSMCGATCRTRRGLRQARNSGRNDDTGCEARSRDVEPWLRAFLQEHAGNDYRLDCVPRMLDVFAVGYSSSLDDERQWPAPGQPRVKFLGITERSVKAAAGSHPA
jgi:hypothetical protein